jgi:hypothetical protein
LAKALEMMMTDTAFEAASPSPDNTKSKAHGVAGEPSTGPNGEAQIASTPY